MPRGGSRAGKPGVAHAQRTDLNAPKLPATAVPGQPYGQAGQQLAAQQTIPMGSPPLPAPPESSGGPMPGELPGLTSASALPNQPVQHGLPVGPGAGPEALPSAPDPVLKGLAILNTMKSLPPELKAVQAYLQVSQNNGLNG